MAEAVDHPALLRLDQIIVGPQIEIILRRDLWPGGRAFIVEGEAARRHRRKAGIGIGGIERRIGAPRRRDTGKASIGDIAAAAGDEAKLAAARDTAQAGGRREGRAGPVMAAAARHDASIVERVIGKAAALPARNRVALEIVARHNQIATPVGKIAAHRQVDGVDGRAGGAIHVKLGARFHAFEIVAHDEVDDAGDGIGAVDGRRTTRHDFRARNQARRDRVEIGNLLRTINGIAPPIDQHQIAGRTKATQVDVGKAAGNGIRGRATQLRADHLRQLRQRLFDVHIARELDVFGADHADRGRGIEAIACDARSGDDDVCGCAIRTALRLLGSSDSRRFGGILLLCQRWHNRTKNKRGSRQETHAQRLYLLHSILPFFLAMTSWSLDLLRRKLLDTLSLALSLMAVDYASPTRTSSQIDGRDGSA